MGWQRGAFRGKKRKEIKEMFQASETAQAKGRLVFEERILYSRRFDLREQHENVF